MSVRSTIDDHSRIADTTSPLARPLLGILKATYIIIAAVTAAGAIAAIAVALPIAVVGVVATG